MTIILFLVDTSASMSQRTYLGARPTLLDVAKDAVEKFLKLRQRDPASRGDRYMLLTFEDPPFNIKAGWKENHNAFMTELKNLTATGMTNLGPSLKHSFDLLNINRMQTGIDTYGQGRCPFYLEPSIIVVITDGGKLSTSSAVMDQLTLPMNSTVPGSELTKEPFRWDQRMFALVLKLTGTVPNDHLSPLVSLPIADDSPIDSMCTVTGGRSYAVTSQRSLMNCLESIVSKIQGGVVIHFEKVGPDPVPISPPEINNVNSNGQSNVNSNGNNNGTPLLHGALLSPSLHEQVICGLAKDSFNCESEKNNWTSCRKLIYVQRSAQKGYSVGHWPIPESFWPEISSQTLPARSAQPVIKFMCQDTHPVSIENLPFDKYELEASPLTRFILNRKSSHVSWPCYVSGSGKSIDSLGQPFGYLKASSNLTCVNLFVLPYNYPALLPLLQQFMDMTNNGAPGTPFRPTREWKLSFDSYLNNLPGYYCGPLKRALQRLGVPSTLIPDSMETCLSYQVLNYLKRLKNQAKAEFDKTVSSVGSSSSFKLPVESIRVNNAIKTAKIHDIVLSSYDNYNLNHPRFQKIKSEINDYQSFTTRIKDKYSEVKGQSYRNPFDISRHELIDQIYRMKSNFLLPYNSMRLQDEDTSHSLPVNQMGNYQEYLKRIPSPLRELESAPTRQHMFGNPFKIDKRGNQGVQVPMEDIDLVGGDNNQGNSSPNSSPTRSPKRTFGSSDASNPNRNKRKPGPLPKDFVLRSLSPIMSPPMSPIPGSPSRSLSPSPPPAAMIIDGIEQVSSVVESSFVDLASNDGDEDVDNEVNKIFDDDITLISSNINHSHHLITPSDSDDADECSEPPNKKRLIAGNSPVTTDEDEKYSLVLKHDCDLVQFDPKDVQSKHHSKNNFDYAKVNGSSNTISNACSNSNSGVNSSSPGSRAGLINSPPLDMNSFSYPINGSKRRVLLQPEEITIKNNILTMVKQPGHQCYQKLLDSICNISSSSFREYMIHEVKNEAKRFKRKNLIDFLNQKLIFINNNGNHKDTSPLPAGSPSPRKGSFSNSNNSNSSSNNAAKTNSRRNPLLKSCVE